MLVAKGCGVDLLLTMFTGFVDVKLVERQVKCHESYSIGSLDVGDGIDRRKSEAKMHTAIARVCRSKKFGSKSSSWDGELETMTCRRTSFHGRPH